MYFSSFGQYREKSNRKTWYQVILAKLARFLFGNNQGNEGNRPKPDKKKPVPKLDKKKSKPPRRDGSRDQEEPRPSNK